ncbi:MAG: hypothetical protein EXR45_08210 [Chloroflexi bacterium]|nr:hypothetical protein [Chloroflexota bacterium]
MEPPRDGSPARFRRPLATDPDETDRDDVPRTGDSALCSASLELLSSALIDTRAYAGCRSVETYVDQDNPDVIVLWEKWDDRPSFETYLAWRVATGLVETLDPYLASERTVHLSNVD